MNNLSKPDSVNLSPPSLRQIVVASLLSWNRKRAAAHVFQHIGKYTFVKGAHNGTKENFFSGIYSDGTVKVFIKNWAGASHNIEYYGLVNEYFASQIIRQMLQASANGQKVYTPGLLECLSTGGSLSLVYKYIDGKNLVSASPEIQLAAMHKIRGALLSNTGFIKQKGAKYLTRRSATFYLLSMPVVLAVFLYFFPQHFYITIRRTFFGLASVPSLFRQDLVLSHRDISPENIIVSGGRTFIADLELVVIAPRSLDPVMMLINSDSESLRVALLNSLKNEINPFLFIRLLLHAMIDMRHSAKAIESNTRLLYNFKNI